MDFFLVPNDPQRTVLVSPNGVAHYQISTAKEMNGAQLSLIQRPADSEADSIVAEIEWGTFDTPTFVRCPLLPGIGRCVGKMGLGVTARTFLYRRHPFSKSRYFIGDDGVEYRWKMRRGIGYVLTSSGDNAEIARYTSAFNDDGFFAGERRSFLRIQPCSIDLDLVVLSFMIMEKKRRERAGDGTKLVAHDKDPQGDGAADGAGEG